MPWFSDCAAICRRDVALREFTWYRLGGPARWLVTPRGEAELAAVVAACREEGIAWRVLGLGANVLVRDQGFDGAVIRLQGEAWEQVEMGEGPGRIGAGADFVQLVKSSVAHGLAGLERLAGIPGTMGGVIRMNAGGRHGCIADFVRRVRVLGPDGQVRDRSSQDVGFAYRHSRLDGCIVLSAELELQPGDPAELAERHRAIWNEKYLTQPPLAQRSSGCVFKNPPGQAAGRLVDQAGLKGVTCGGAQISPKHANFVVASAGATAQNVLDLIALAKDRVWNQAGVELQLEVEIW